LIELAGFGSLVEKEGIRKDVRAAFPAGLVTATIAACCYMGPVTLPGFVYGNVRM